MRACGTVLRNSLVCSIRGKTMSSAYLVWPVHLAVASTLRKGFPITRKLPPWAPLLPATNALLWWFGRFARQPGGSQFHRFKNLEIPGTPANVSGERLFNLLARWPRHVLQQCFCREEHSRRAIAALPSS